MSRGHETVEVHNEPKIPFIKGLVYRLFNRQRREEVHENPEKPEHIKLIESIVAPETGSLPEGIFLRLEINKDNIGDLPDPNPEGVPENAPLAKTNPAVTLTISDPKLMIKLGIFIDNKGNYLAEISGQEWQTVFSPSEWTQLRNAMQAVFEDGDLKIKRVSVVEGNYRSGESIRLREFKGVYGVDLEQAIQRSAKAIDHVPPDSSRIFTIQTETGSNKADGYYNWDRDK